MSGLLLVTIFFNLDIEPFATVVKGDKIKGFMSRNTIDKAALYEEELLFVIIPTPTWLYRTF